MIFPALTAATDRLALRFAGTDDISYTDLAGAAAAVGTQISGARRVAVWATPTVHTALAVIGALASGTPVVPINPKIGEKELAHILNDSTPDLMLAEPSATISAEIPRIDIDPAARARADFTAVDPQTPGFIVYTSGTTGPPKGVVQPQRSISATIAALADAWQWSGKDTVVQALPLFHVHGLVLGVLGPVVLGGTVHHVGKFEVDAVADAVVEHGSSMVFGVPTMYTRITSAVENDRDLATKFAAARLLVSGSAPLPASVHQRMTAATGSQIVERYGMTETFMNASVRADGERRPGTVGIPLAGADIRMVDEHDNVIVDSDDETVGELEVRGDNVFTEYLNNPEATAKAFHDGWFRTGDMATRAADGYLRIVGRRSTDLIKSAGYRIGAGEIENCLLEHHGVAEVAVTAEPDEDLGERVVAWVVATETTPTPEELMRHVSEQLTAHKSPRVVRFVSSLPRNDMGKVVKRELRAE